MAVPDWIGEVTHYLGELRNIDLGYPLGSNVVLPPQEPSFVQAALLEVGLERFPDVAAFYSQCDGISWPDVHVGYFLKPIDRVVDFNPESEPRLVTGAFSDNVITLGSTGGGGLFVLRLVSGGVLYLPPGRLHAGVYDGAAAEVREVSAGFSQFLKVLLEDLVAFVRDSSGHQFIV
jgi:hypothetical protein